MPIPLLASSVTIIIFLLNLHPAAASPVQKAYDGNESESMIEIAARDDDDPTPSRDKAPRIFLDCDRCDSSYLRKEITFVNHVRDPQDADVHLLITDIRNGSGGSTYTLNFIGQGSQGDMHHVLTYTTSQTNTSEEVRSGLAQQIKLGLLPYVARTPLASLVTVRFRDQALQASPISDPWNHWVFRLNGSGYVNLEESQSRFRFNTSFSADRITEDWRIRTYSYTRNDLRQFEQDSETIESRSRRAGLSASAVKSLGPHWSLGYSGSASTSTFNNLDYSISSGPAIEYNIFPYSESTSREFTFAYRLNYRYQDYDQITIFDKMSESLLRHSLEARLRVREKWGETNATLEGSHYLHDPSKNRLELSGNIHFRIVKGLSLNLSSALELIHDQLYLAKGDASLEELLLQQRQLATTYEFRSSVGLSYTFGSIYNNVVNTRL